MTKARKPTKPAAKKAKATRKPKAKKAPAKKRVSKTPLLDTAKAQRKANAKVKTVGSDKEPTPPSVPKKVKKRKRRYSTTNRPQAGKETTLEKDRARKSVMRAAGRDIVIPDVVNPQRRERCEKDPELFLKTYMPIKFKNPFCRHHSAMIAGLEECLHYSGWQSMAAPRGDGKSSIAEGMIIRAINYGFRHFPVLIGATETDAQQRKAAISELYEDSPILLEDFPEICFPIRELGKSGRKGNQQTIDGEFTNIQWPSGVKAREMRFPIVPGSRASGAWLVIRGMEKGKVRGTKYGNARPDLVVLDDIESQQSVRSEEQTAFIEEKIDREVIPLAGPNESLAIFYPCTIIAVGCIADRMTDPARHPEYAAWMGQRHALIIEWPNVHGLEGEEDLWALFRRMWREDQLNGDRLGRRAHQYYLDHREVMDAGCIVSNKHRFDSKECPDGSKLQTSTLEGMMQFISNKGDNERAWSTMRAEYQNKPDESNAPEGSDCNEEMIMRSTNGLMRGVCPAGTTCLTVGIDIHKTHIPWVLVAWVGSCGHIVDYFDEHTYATGRPMHGNIEVTESVKASVLTTLAKWRAESAEGWPIEGTNDRMKKVDRVFIDSRFLSDAIFAFVGESERPTYQAVTGSGTGKTYSNYRPPHKNSKHARLGNFHYYIMYQNDRRLWLTHADSDYWKGHIQDGFVIADGVGPDRPADEQDAMVLFGSDKLFHKEFAPQIMAEELTTRFKPGQGYQSEWVVKYHDNHYLDCLVYACTAAAMAGVRFGHMAAPRKASARRGPRVAGRVEQFTR